MDKSNPSSSQPESTNKPDPGFKFSIKYILRFGIILLGIRLGLLDILKIGITFLPGFGTLKRRINVTKSNVCVIINN